MFEEMIQLFNLMVKDEKLLPSVAKVQGAYRDSLINDGGFSREEAMQILCSQSIINNGGNSNNK